MKDEAVSEWAEKPENPEWLMLKTNEEACKINAVNIIHFMTHFTSGSSFNDKYALLMPRITQSYLPGPLNILHSCKIKSACVLAYKGKWHLVIS